MGKEAPKECILGVGAPDKEDRRLLRIASRAEAPGQLWFSALTEVHKRRCSEFSCLQMGLAGKLMLGAGGGL